MNRDSGKGANAEFPADFFAPPRIEMTRRPDGAMILESRDELQPYARCVGDYLLQWASEAPERIFLAQRTVGEDGEPGDWREITYSEVLARVTALAGGLLKRGLGPDRPLAILSGNSLAHALLALAAMHVGVPVVPLSPAYSLMSQDFGKLKGILSLVRPGMIFVETPELFAPALRALEAGDADLVAAKIDGAARGFDTVDALADEGTGKEADVAEAFAALTPDSVAKILFTSGSTGSPKGVINTQRMLCSNQQAIRQSWPFLEQRPPILVDWLPWNHTFGGNFTFNLALANGGSLYIDEGKPMPGAVEVTVVNLKSMSPTVYFNVPGGIDALLPYLESDDELAHSLFRRLDTLFYAAAALPQASWKRLEKVAVKATGQKPVFTSGWGSTETAPGATLVHFPISRPDTIGVPGAGITIKMTPVGDTHELRVKGPNVMPGYLGDPELTQAAFDKEGFYRIGDAGKLEDPDNPARGIAFDGRLGENFKLRSGTWVSVGNLRLQVIGAAKPVIRDAVIAGEGEEFAAVIAFPNEVGCRQVIREAGGDVADDASAEELIAHPAVREWVRRGLARHNAENDAGSTRIRRLILTAAPPDIDAGETTDKGYLNQRGILRNRAALVGRLFAEDVSGDDDIIEIA